MLFDSKLSNRYWGEAIQTANYLQNMTPTKALSQNTTPFEEWFGFPPTLSHLKVFGCTTYALIPKERRQKLEFHMIECLFKVIVKNLKLIL